MAQVTIRINGYNYTVGCLDGEEDHLAAMADEVDRRIDSMRKVVGSSAEGRMLVLIALSLADELAEMKRSIQDGTREKRHLINRLNCLARRADQIASET